MKIKAVYGIDPTRSGFFNPAWTQKKKELMEVRRGDPVTFHSTYQGEPSTLAGNVFVDSDFRLFLPVADLELGIQNPNVKFFVDQGHSLIQAWDTAYSEKREADYSVCVTGLLWACEEYHRPENDPALIGPCEPHFDLYVLDVFRELLDFPDLTNNIKQQGLKWKPSRILIEEKVSGISALQVLRSAGLNVEGVKSVEGKRARATTVVGTASAVGWMRLHRVLFPSNASWFEKLKSEFISFDGSGNGYDDQVDALVTAIVFTILQSSGGVVKIGATPSTPQEVYESKPDFLTILGPNTAINTSFYDPMETTCFRCSHYVSRFCNVHNRFTIPMDTCDFFESKE